MQWFKNKYINKNMQGWQADTSKGSQADVNWILPFVNVNKFSQLKKKVTAHNYNQYLKHIQSANLQSEFKICSKDMCTTSI